MSDLFWLADEKVAPLRLYFPKSHGCERIDDRRVLGGIISVNRHGLRWRDAPREYGPAMTLCNQWVLSPGTMPAFAGMTKVRDAECPHPVASQCKEKAHRLGR